MARRFDQVKRHDIVEKAINNGSHSNGHIRTMD